MPLTNSQQDYINSSIGHFFMDLPEDPQAFDQIEKEIALAFERKLEEKSDFYFLQQCIYQPEYNLRRVEEESNSGISVGDIQKHIFTYTTNELQKVAQKINVDLKALSNIKDAFMNSCENNQAPFQSRKLAEESKGSPLDIDKEDWELFEAKIIEIDDLTLETIVEVRVMLPSREITDVISMKFPPTVLKADVTEQDRQDYSASGFFVMTQDEFHEHATINAKIRAKHLAIEKVGDYFVEKGLVNEKDVEGYYFCPGIDLIAHQYYFKLINEKQVSLEKIASIESKRLPILTAPHIVDLLESKQIAFADALKLTPWHTRLVMASYYRQQLRDKHLDAKQILALTKKDCQQLVLPCVIRLMEQGRLSFANAKSLSPFACMLLTSEFYFRLIDKDPQILNLIKNISEEKAAMLLMPGMMRHVNDRQDVVCALRFGDDEFKLLENTPDKPNNIAVLFNKGILSPRDIQIIAKNASSVSAPLKNILNTLSATDSHNKFVVKWYAAIKNSLKIFDGGLVSVPGVCREMNSIIRNTDERAAVLSQSDLPAHIAQAVDHLKEIAEKGLNYFQQRTATGVNKRSRSAFFETPSWQKARLITLFEQLTEFSQLSIMQPAGSQPALTFRI